MHFVAKTCLFYISCGVLSLLYLLKLLNFEGDVMLWRKGGNVEAIEGRQCVWYLTLKVTAFIILGEDWNSGPQNLYCQSPGPSL